MRAAEATLTAARRQLELIASQRRSADASVAAARARLDAALINLDSTVVRAPMDGVVGNRKVQVGRFVSAGAALLDVVHVDDLWVQANLRETELEKVAPGQAVRITVDGFPDAAITGVVDSIAPGSGASFSLIPPDNATGNFVRIVQLVPVKIRLNDMPAAVRLVPGLSARVAIRSGGEATAALTSAMDDARAGSRVPVAAYEGTGKL